MEQQWTIRFFTNSKGKRPFLDWLENLAEARTRARILVQVRRIQQGNFNRCKPVGDGIQEIKIDFGPGYRVYFGTVRNEIIILLTGGNKTTQERDIRRAGEFWVYFKRSTQIDQG